MKILAGANVGRHMAAICSAIVCASIGPLAWSQPPAYPNRPVVLVVPYAAGGIADVVARAVATPMSKELGQPVVIENVTGGGGNIGSMRVASAEPDGYTLLVAQTSTVTNPLLDRTVKFNATTSFTHVAYLGSLPLWLLVNPSTSRHTSLDSLVKAMREAPGKLNYGSGGTGSASHLGVAYFEATEKVSAQHVPYRGMSAALTDLLGGSVDFALTPVAGSESLVKANKLKALAITGKSRSTAFAQVPTFAEAGFPRMDVMGWVGISGPAGLPADVTNRLRGALTKTLAEPALKQTLLERTLIASGSPVDFATFVSSESKRWGELIAKTGIKGD